MVLHLMTISREEIGKNITIKEYIEDFTIELEEKNMAADPLINKTIRKSLFHFLFPFYGAYLILKIVDALDFGFKLNLLYWSLLMGALFTMALNNVTFQFIFHKNKDYPLKRNIYALFVFILTPIALLYLLDPIELNHFINFNPISLVFIIFSTLIGISLVISFDYEDGIEKEN